MSLRMIVGLVLKASIMLTLFGFGLHATREDLLYLLRRPRVLARSLVAIFMVMPLFAILLTRLGSFNRARGHRPHRSFDFTGPPLLPRKVTKSGGHAPYGLGLMVTAASFSVVFVPTCCISDWEILQSTLCDGASRRGEINCAFRTGATRSGYSISKSCARYCGAYR